MHKKPRTLPALLAAGLLATTQGACATDRHPEQQTATSDTVAQVVATPATAAELPPSTPGYRFVDAQGNEPLSLTVREGQRVSAVLLDTAAMTIPVMAARDRAQTVARKLWTEIGSAAKADTVSVAFTGPPAANQERATREFFFYASDLAAGS